MLAVLGPGEAFGELALLSPGARRAAPVASLDEGETLSVFRDEFALLRSVRPGLKASSYASSPRSSRGRPTTSSKRTTLTRTRGCVGGCSTSPPHAARGHLAVSLTQEHLAAMAGTSRATVNKVLREEEERGTVELGRGCTTVLDLEDLESRCK